MARPRRDGTPAKAVDKRKLTDLFVASRKGADRNELIWDALQHGLALLVRATGHKAWKVIYRRHGRPVWLHLGDAGAIGLADARRLAARVMLTVAEGRDPAAERKAERMAGSFADLAHDYFKLHASKRNKSWKQSEYWVRKHLLPRWSKLKPQSITRADVRAMMLRIEAPILANQVLASASAIFTWAIRQEIVAVNPCALVDRNPTRSRERVLSDAEIELLWPRLDPALKLILLTGQRPGEVGNMQRDHITADGWWQLPGKPVGTWPGTKNGRDHRVWLSEPAQALFASKSRWTSARLLRKLVADLKIERATPHDLRRTALTWITRLGFGRDAMDRVANHKTNSVTDVYDRFNYFDEDKRIMSAIARHVLAIVEGTPTGKVVNLC